MVSKKGLEGWCADAPTIQKKNPKKGSLFPYLRGFCTVLCTPQTVFNANFSVHCHLQFNPNLSSILTSIQS